MKDQLPFLSPNLENKDDNSQISFYEEVIENNPLELNNYWLMGLLYLKNNQMEEAKTVWLMPFLSDNDNNHDEIEKSLLTVLLSEAQKQELQNQYDLAYSIRSEIKEIAPKNIANLFELLCLSVKLKQFESRYIYEWNLLSLIENAHNNELEFQQIYKVLNILIPYPLMDNVKFAEIILHSQKEKSELLKLIYLKADTNNLVLDLPEISSYLEDAQKQNYKFEPLIYIKELIELCLKFQPKDFLFIKRAYWIYFKLKDYDNCTKIGERLVREAETFFEKILGKYYLIHSKKIKGDWREIVNFIEEYKQLLQELDSNLNELPKAYRDSFVLFTYNLIYTEDNPQENRPIINKISQLFQRLTHEDYSCPIAYSQNQLANKRKLKIGYIGHTFRTHAVGILSRWLINYHDFDRYSIYLYHLNGKEDSITQRWFNNSKLVVRNLADDVNTVITCIEKDEIDILIDLDSFTSPITSLIMALKPATIQVSWLGLDSVGLPAVDYFIVDPHVLPSDAQKYYQEKIWRLPNTYIAVDGFEVDYPTITRRELEIPEESIVYLSLQTPLKRHPDIIHVQMKILNKVPNSYFIISGGNTETTSKTLNELLTSIAEEEGINPERIKIMPFFPPSIYRANLTIGDIVLDSYPFNGATTTLDALWLNIPLVTRVGQQFHARQGYTFLTNLGITEGIGWNDQEYIEWGIKLGTDENLRKEVAWKLRQSKKTSPLWNGKQFAKEMEKAYQQMWDAYFNQ